MTDTQNITFANAPTWGATGIQHALADDPLVSIHAPTLGATTCLWSLASIRVL